MGSASKQIVVLRFHERLVNSFTKYTVMRWRGLSCGNGILGFNAFPPSITKHITSHPTHSPFFNQTRPFQAPLVVHISGGVFSAFVFLDRDILPQVVLAHLVHWFS